MDRMKELHKMRGMGGGDEDWEKMMENRPMFGDRMARGAQDIRSRLDEARRVNIEEMRQLQRCMCVCVCACAMCDRWRNESGLNLML